MFLINTTMKGSILSRNARFFFLLPVEAHSYNARIVEKVELIYYILSKYVLTQYERIMGVSDVGHQIQRLFFFLENLLSAETQLGLTQCMHTFLINRLEDHHSSTASHLELKPGSVSHSPCSRQSIQSLPSW